MAKIRTEWKEETYVRWVKEGRGQGTGANYKPWLTIHDFASKGIVSRALGRKTGRVYQLFSGLEMDYFLLLDSNDLVEDIREQFPLRLHETIELACEMNIKHPRYPGIIFPAVMTTDFLITLKDGREVARAVKPSKDLDNVRTVEKLMLERAYFERKGIDWKIVTEHEINSEKASNLRWLYYGENEYRHEIMTEYENEFLNLYADRSLPFSSILEIIEEGYSLPHGTGISIFKHLIRSEQIQINMEKKISLTEPRIYTK